MGILLTFLSLRIWTDGEKMRNGVCSNMGNAVYCQYAKGGCGVIFQYQRNSMNPILTNNTWDSFLFSFQFLLDVCVISYLAIV